MNLVCQLKELEQKINKCRAIARHQDKKFLTPGIRLTRARYYRSLLKRRQIIIERVETIQALDYLGVCYKLTNNIFYV